MEILFYLATITLFLLILSNIELAVGNRKIKWLKDISANEGSNTPKVSIIVPACNEEKNIEVALKSLVTQNYKNLEIIVVNDRSTDETASILERLANEYSNITISNISELPLGWVGKNHALYNGAKQAKGEYLLFTDADIVMDSTAIQRAVYHMQQNKLDHIAVMPEIKMPGFILNLLCVAFYAYFGLLFKPWKVKSLKSKRSIGVGAFNLMRRQAYLESGTLKAVSMRIDDDIQLGKIIKKKGFNQEFMIGKGLLSVEWYSSFKGMVDGLTKNFFTILNYNIGISFCIYLATYFVLHCAFIRGFSNIGDNSIFEWFYPSFSTVPFLGQFICLSIESLVCLWVSFSVITPYIYALEIDFNYSFR
tara:strand:+ start:504 stop:1595 length:1092 start_codon:yes stop_codon:yes gene_type:complete